MKEKQSLAIFTALGFLTGITEVLADGSASKIIEDGKNLTVSAQDSKRLGGIVIVKATLDSESLSFSHLAYDSSSGGYRLAQGNSSSVHLDVNATNVDNFIISYKDKSGERQESLFSYNNETEVLTIITPSPTLTPSVNPTTGVPTRSPVQYPTISPTTFNFTHVPSTSPSGAPTINGTLNETSVPTGGPEGNFTSSPTATHTYQPSTSPVVGAGNGTNPPEVGPNTTFSPSQPTGFITPTLSPQEGGPQLPGNNNTNPNTSVFGPLTNEQGGGIIAGVAALLLLFGARLLRNRNKKPPETKPGMDEVGGSQDAAQVGHFSSTHDAEQQSQQSQEQKAANTGSSWLPTWLGGKPKTDVKAMTAHQMNEGHQRGGHSQD